LHSAAAERDQAEQMPGGPVVWRIVDHRAAALFRICQLSGLEVREGVCQAIGSGCRAGFVSSKCGASSTTHLASPGWREAIDVPQIPMRR
jgi:hypothetical protein